MKKFSLFLFALAFLLFSCTENLENHGVQKKSGNVLIKITDSSSGARFLSPVDSFDISKVTEWSLTFTQLAPANGKGEVSKCTLKSGETSVTLGVGTYDLYMEGSYTNSTDNSSTTINLSAEKTDITVTEGKTTELSVVVGLKKTAGGTGDFAVTFTFDNTQENGNSWKTYYTDYGETVNNQTDYSSGIKVTLVSWIDSMTEYSTENGYLTINTDDAEKSCTLTVSNPTDKKIPSGYYYLYFYADYSVSGDTESEWRKVPFNSDNLVEIADDQENIGGEFIDLIFPNTPDNYTYYASDSGTNTANGLAQSNPGTLASILENIYANNSIINATINYTYSDQIKFDISKIGTGKSISVQCTKADSFSNDTPNFSLNSDSSVSYTMYSETINFFTTDNDKTKLSLAGTCSGNVALSDNVYIDLTAIDASTFGQSPICLDNVDDYNYYKTMPIAVYNKNETLNNDPLCFNQQDFSDYSSDGSEPQDFDSYDLKQNTDSGQTKFYLEETPSVYVKYYGNSGSTTDYVIGNDSSDFKEANRSIASWCDDKNGGLYVFEATTEYSNSSYKLTSSPTYSLVHYNKIEKGAYYILHKESVSLGTGVSVNNVPVSMCTDGSNIYFVESLLDISTHSAETPDFGNWGAWAYKDCKVKYISIENLDSVQELDFSTVFTGGKVTAVYYNDGLYVAGYKRESIGSVTTTSDNDSETTKFYDSICSVYKLATATDVNSASLISDVLKTSTENTDRIVAILNSGTQTGYSAGVSRVMSYNAITDMAIMNGTLCVLENSYYSAHYNNADYYGAGGSLRRVSLEKGNVLDPIYKTDSDTTGTDSFKVPNKILAVLPKKLKLIIADSGKEQNDANGVCYTVDLSDADKISVTESVPDGASGHYFDDYSSIITGSGLYTSTAFTENACYTSKATSEEFDKE